MESFQQLHKQLDNLEELRTIVKTMKALSAASIRQYEQAVEALSGYYQTIERGLHAVLKDMHALPAPDPARAADVPRGVVVFGSDHGLCGRFNEEITQRALAHISSNPAKPEVLCLAVGARVGARLEQEGQQVEEVFFVPGSATQIASTVQQILIKIDEWREGAAVHDVHLFYNRHSAREGYEPTEMRLLPIDLRRFHRLQEERWPSRSLPMYTMASGSLLSRLLHHYLFVLLFRACAESQSSEHASRLAAMQSAERNLDARLEDVTMLFRRARQDAITSELLDVVSGFEVIMGQPN